MRVCVFGASSDLIQEEYKQAAYNLGKSLAENGHVLVFGGGKSGLMGAIARGFSAGKGYIIGVAPEIFDSEEILYACNEIIITKNLVDRKQQMMQLSDAFISLAGGIGTYDELFEALASKQLNYHQKPVILYNTLGYYDKLVEFFMDTHQKGFMGGESLQLYHVCKQPEEVNKILEG